MKVAKWGNSLAVRLPRPVVEALDLKEGDEVQIEAAGAKRLEVARDRQREEALARIRELSMPLPSGYVFNREELHDRAGFRPDPDGSDEP